MFLHVSVCPQGRWYPSMQCRWYPSIPCRSPDPHPGGKLRGLAWGSPGPHPGWGVSSGPHPGGIPACAEARHLPPPADGYCRGWYASYWNAFLFFFFFFKYYLEDISPFCGAADTPVKTSGYIFPGFQTQARFPLLYALLPAHNGILRFTSGVAHGSWAYLLHILAYKHWWCSSPGLSILLPNSMWQDSRSTDWARPPRKWK